MIPLATTTVSIRGVRPAPSQDPTDDDYPAPGVLYSGIRACISASSPRRRSNAQEVEAVRFRADPCDLTIHDVVVDEVTEIEYRVQSVFQSGVSEFGLEHTAATLLLVEGLGDGDDSA